MTKRAFRVVMAILVAIAVAIRLGNVWTFPSLRGYDGFAHFVYVWFLAETGRIPLAMSGWEFFQPPLYYVAMAAVWRTFSDLDPEVRLRLGVSAFALFGLAQAWVAYRLVRRRLPDVGLPHVLACGLMLFLPVHLYSVGFLGNEGLSAALCALSLLMLVAYLERPSYARAALLGALYGLAMLSKFTAFCVVAAGFLVIGLRALLRRELVPEARRGAVIAAVMLVICGWFYGRNLVEYGNPFQMTRELLMLQRVENFQAQGRRGLAEYLLFDPVVLYRPSWPRGIPIDAGPLPLGEHDALREAVWTGLYANTWFDAFGGWTVPRVTVSELSRRSGQLLLTLGMVPTLLVFAGIGVALRRLRRHGWDDVLVACLVTFAMMMLFFVHATRSVPMHAAVKATYVTPISSIFAFWFALGFDALRRRRAGMARAVVGACAVLAVVAGFTFSFALPWRSAWLQGALEGGAWASAYGVVHYAGGDREEARAWFHKSAASGYHLGQENLAALAMEDGANQEALSRLRLAQALLPMQVVGLPADRDAYVRRGLAEYANLEAIARFRLGRIEDARDAAHRALRLDPKLPEARYDAAVICLALADRARSEVWRSTLLAQARTHLDAALAEDPAYRRAAVLAAGVSAASGDCESATARMEAASAERHRLYPEETGPGDLQAAALYRRREIGELPARIRPDALLERCRKQEAAAS